MSEPICHARELFRASPADSTRYNEYRGYGPPNTTLGRPGDIYLDITKGRLALYGRLEIGTTKWHKWERNRDRPVAHWRWPEYYLWCTDQMVGWLDKTSKKMVKALSKKTIQGPTPVLVEFLKSKQKFPKVDERTSRASTQTAPPATPKQGSAAQPFVIESSPEPEDIASKATPPISKASPLFTPDTLHRSGSPLLPETELPAPRVAHDTNPPVSMEGFNDMDDVVVEHQESPARLKKSTKDAVDRIASHAALKPKERLEPLRQFPIASTSKIPTLPSVTKAFIPVKKPRLSPSKLRAATIPGAAASEHIIIVPRQPSLSGKILARKPPSSQTAAKAVAAAELRKNRTLVSAKDIQMRLQATTNTPARVAETTRKAPEEAATTARKSEVTETHGDEGPGMQVTDEEPETQAREGEEPETSIRNLTKTLESSPKRGSLPLKVKTLGSNGSNSAKDTETSGSETDFDLPPPPPPSRRRPSNGAGLLSASKRGGSGVLSPKTPTGERPFTCFCGKSFQNRNALKDHGEKTHSTQRGMNEATMRKYPPGVRVLSQGSVVPNSRSSKHMDEESKGEDEDSDPPLPPPPRRTVSLPSSTLKKVQSRMASDDDNDELDNVPLNILAKRKAGNHTPTRGAGLKRRRTDLGVEPRGRSSTIEDSEPERRETEKRRLETSLSSPQTSISALKPSSRKLPPLPRRSKPGFSSGSQSTLHDTVPKTISAPNPSLAIAVPEKIDENMDKPSSTPVQVKMEIAINIPSWINGAVIDLTTSDDDDDLDVPINGQSGKHSVEPDVGIEQGQSLVLAVPAKAIDLMMSESDKGPTLVNAGGDVPMVEASSAEMEVDIPEGLQSPTEDIGSDEEDEDDLDIDIVTLEHACFPIVYGTTSEQKIVCRLCMTYGDPKNPAFCDSDRLQELKETLLEHCRYDHGDQWYYILEHPRRQYQTYPDGTLGGIPDDIL